MPTVSVVVLNYNGLKHLEPCFRSLMALDYPADRLELMLVDNGSRDKSLDFMRENFPSVRLVETGGNIGFAAGNNYGAERATGEYVAFLNNDTRVEPDWLSEMVKTVMEGRESGLVCTGSLMLDWKGKKIDFKAAGVNFHGFGFQPSYGKPYVKGEIEPRDILFACGGSMLIDRALFVEIGGFDPDYFAFFEDVDLGWRLWILGYRVTLTPSAITYHRHHGTADNIANHRLYVLFERNALYTIYKNYQDEHVHKILSAALLLLGGRTVRFIESSGADLGDFDWNAEPDAETDMNVHRQAVAALIAVNEFMDNMNRTREKRDWLQARRKRGDRELFSLFEQPGRVNWINHASDARYTTAHYDLLELFGIAELWKGLPKEVLMISPDVLPVGDIPASGSGIRAWALGKGLEAEGHNVHYTMPAPAIKGREGSVPQEYVDGAWTTENLQSIIDNMVPDVIVSCGWPNMTWTPRLNVPTAVDLTGPHLFERAYQGYKDALSNSEEKLEALAKGDFFTCIGERQKYYFEAWMVQAGVPVERLTDSLAVVPYSVNPQLPAHHWPTHWAETEVRFVYGGIFLPWQNPAPALTTLAKTLEEEKRGMLEVIGGKHPFYPIQTGVYGPLIALLSKSERVRMSGLLPFDQLEERYTNAHVAVDMIMPNAERELAFPSRTVHYLWCGLPVIHPAFSEVADHIRRYEAGWVVRHDDAEGLRDVIVSILEDPEEAHRRGKNAQRLASEVFGWNKTSGPLAQFVRHPTMRPERAMPPRSRRTGTQAASAGTSKKPVRISAPEGYLITEAWDKKLPAKLEPVYGKRRTLPAQIRSRSSSLLKAFTGRKREAVDGQMRTALPELVAGHSHAQRFYCNRNGLSGIIVAPATFNRKNTCRIVLHIRTNPGASADIYSVNLPAYTLHDTQPLAFRFPPIPDSAGRWFYFVMDSPDGVPGDAVSLYATARAEELEAQRYEDGLPADGVLVMSLEFN